MSKKYVLQWGSLASWPFKVAEGLSKAGIESRNVVAQEFDVEDLDRKLPYHRALYRSGRPRLMKLASRLGFLLETLRDCSLVHYHGSVILNGYFHPYLEGRMLAAANIPMLMSFGGGDARIVEMARAKNPYFYREADPERDRQTRRYLKSISQFVRYAATDYEMIDYVEPYFEKCFVFRQPVDLAEFPEAPLEERDCPVVLHVPTQTDVKGTHYVLSAVEKLKSEGVRFEFRYVRQLTQKEFYQQIRECDIYIDDLRCGAHGVTAVETMAAGKPTVTYIRDDLLEKYPKTIPLVNANPDTIYGVLKDLLADFSRRREIGIAGRRYVEKYHDISVIAEELKTIYREIGLR